MTREQRTFVAFGFASTHDALDAEALLGDMGVDVVPIPAPAAFSGTCGIALRVEPAEAERAREYMERADITIAHEVEILDV